jgi:predicted DNA-binding transcriptional regulator AlpA
MTAESPYSPVDPGDRQRAAGAGASGSRLVVLADLDALRAVVADALSLRLAQLEARLVDLVSRPKREDALSAPHAALLNEHEVSVRLGLSGRTIRRLESAGDFPRALRLGTSKRWRPEDVEEWLARHQRRG